MGIFFYIRREEASPKSAESPITKDEWKTLIASDPELRLDPDNNHWFGEVSANWVDRSGQERGWFSWAKDGFVFTNKADREQLAKMLQIAERLGGHVHDEYGENYTRPEDLSDEADKALAAFDRNTWWWAFGSAMMCLCFSIIGLWLLGWFSLFLWAMTALLLVFCYITFKS